MGMEGPVPIITVSGSLDGNDNHYAKKGCEINKENKDEPSEKIMWCCFREGNTVTKTKRNNKKTFTLKQKVALPMLATAEFMSFCSMSIMAPFYPAEATSRGVSGTMSGFVFGFYALIVFLSSPIFGKIMPTFGVKRLFTLGLLISGVSSVLFGMLNMVQDYYLFVWMSFLIRGFGALGTSAYSTAAYVIISNLFPSHASTVRGLLETFVGLGMSAGPGIGGLLFAVVSRLHYGVCFWGSSSAAISVFISQKKIVRIIAGISSRDSSRPVFKRKIGGFGLPFYVVGFVITLMALLNVMLLPPVERRKQEKNGSLLKLLKLSPVLVTSLIIVVMAMTWGFLDPTLEPHLRKFGLSAGNIGLIFLLFSAMYGIFSPIWGWLSDRIDNYWWLMIIGMFLNSFVLMLLGPSPMLSFLQESVWLNIACLSVLGVSVAMGLMPTYQYIVDISVQNEFPESLGTQSIIAGLWSSAYSLGEVIGPILGGTLLEHYGFAVTSTSFATINFLLAVIAMIYFRNRKTIKSTVLPISTDLEAAVYYPNKSELPSIKY